MLTVNLLCSSHEEAGLVSFALLQIRDAGAGQSGLEILVAPKVLGVGHDNGRKRIARVRVVVLSLCNGGLLAAMRRRCHVDCGQRKGIWLRS